MDRVQKKYAFTSVIAVLVISLCAITGCSSGNTNSNSSQKSSQTVSSSTSQANQALEPNEGANIQHLVSIPTQENTEAVSMNLTESRTFNGVVIPVDPKWDLRVPTEKKYEQARFWMEHPNAEPIGATVNIDAITYTHGETKDVNTYIQYPIGISDDDKVVEEGQWTVNDCIFNVFSIYQSESYGDSYSSFLIGCAPDGKTGFAMRFYMTGKYLKDENIALRDAIFSRVQLMPENLKNTLAEAPNTRAQNRAQTSDSPSSSTNTTADVPKDYLTALKSAEQYLSISPHSKQGLYKQLTSEYGEKYSPEAGQYAVDNVKADWKANALKSAEQYLSISPHSKQGLYKQLVSEYGEQYTPEEAQYAVDNVKTDWNEQALKSAHSYQDISNMSPDRIYDQLVSEYGEQYTPEEAQYAVDHL